LVSIGVASSLASKASFWGSSRSTSIGSSQDCAVTSGEVSALESNVRFESTASIERSRSLIGQLQSLEPRNVRPGTGRSKFSLAYNHATCARPLEQAEATARPDPPSPWIWPTAILSRAGGFLRPQLGSEDAIVPNAIPASLEKARTPQYRTGIAKVAGRRQAPDAEAKQIVGAATYGRT
jgi:hypothetical protein